MDLKEIWNIKNNGPIKKHVKNYLQMFIYQNVIGCYASHDIKQV